MNRARTRLLQIVLPVVVLAAAGLGAYTLIQNRPQVLVQVPVFEPPGVRVQRVVFQDVQLTV